MFTILGTILSGLFGKSATVNYPMEPRIASPVTRGHIKIDIDSCIFCGICRRKCPTSAIDVTKEDKTWAISRMHCIQCNSCVESCPKKCLYMRQELPHVSTGIEKEVVELARVCDNAADIRNSK